jgi:uncharacterized repeat protein (TIGR01451 family)
MAGPRTLVAGQLAKYTVTVTNVGKNPARQLLFRNPIPAGFSFVRSSVPSTMAGGAVTARLGPSTKGDTKRVTLTMRVDRSTAGKRENTAQITSIVDLKPTTARELGLKRQFATCGATATAAAPLRVRSIASAQQPSVTG